MDQIEDGLKEEQEKIFLQLSQVLPESSQETNFDEEEKRETTLSDGGTHETNPACKKGKSHCPGKGCGPCRSRKKARKKKCSKRKDGGEKSKSTGEKGRTVKEESHDSGFGTSSDLFSKTQHLEGIRECDTYQQTDGRESRSGGRSSGKRPCIEPLLDAGDSQDSAASAESVSLLQAAGQSVRESKCGVDTGMGFAWNVKIFPQAEDLEEGMDVDDEEAPPRQTADKSAQTVCFHPTREPVGETNRNVNFLRSVVELRRIFSSGRDVPTKRYQDILRNLRTEKESADSPWDLPRGNEPEEMEVEESDAGTRILDFQRRPRSQGGKSSPRSEIISHETIHYVMRTTNVEEVAERSVASILTWMREEVRRDLPGLCHYWRHSARAAAVDAVNAAVDSNVSGARMRVYHFLAEIFDGMCDPQRIVEDATLEYKTTFLSNFCKSIFLLYDMINHVENELRRWMEIRSEGTDPLSKLASVKRTYFILRLLENLFASISDSSNTAGLEDVLKVKPREANPSVLEMWKKHWRKEEDRNCDSMDDVQRRYLSVVDGWCRRTEEVLGYCATQAPLLSLVAHRCSALARRLLLTVEDAFGMS